MKDNGFKVNQNFDWDEIVSGDILRVFDGYSHEKYMAIKCKEGKYLDLMYLTKENKEYTPAGLPSNTYIECINKLYTSTDELEIVLDKNSDREDAIEFAYDKGFKSFKTISESEIKRLLGSSIYKKRT